MKHIPNFECISKTTLKHLNTLDGDECMLGKRLHMEYDTRAAADAQSVSNGFNHLENPFISIKFRISRPCTKLQCITSKQQSSYTDTIEKSNFEPLL